MSLSARNLHSTGSSGTLGWASSLICSIERFLKRIFAFYSKLKLCLQWEGKKWNSLIRHSIEDWPRLPWPSYGMRHPRVPFVCGITRFSRHFVRSQNMSDRAKFLLAPPHPKLTKFRKHWNMNQKSELEQFFHLNGKYLSPRDTLSIPSANFFDHKIVFFSSLNCFSGASISIKCMRVLR